MNASAYPDDIRETLAQIQRRLSNIEDMMKLLIKRRENPEAENLVSIHEAAEMCSLSVRTMYNYSNTGVLNIPVIKRGKHIHFKKSDIIRWMADRNKVWVRY